ncbi:RMD1 family protein [Candidatus Trichorickettsia mobilis]|uniref:RMD1 family protein n=1 Tax=Candidatus Trichorickettsia mobilis TaxID=1346319 RepID=UPI00292F765F|nr:RMD1 family protein [Candidatus Trichorickettsia mobilis]
MSDLVEYLNNNGLEPKHFDDVIYAQKENRKGANHIDIFFFPFGCVTIWGGDEIQEKAILQELLGFEVEKLNNPTSDFIYFDYNKEAEKTFIDEEKNEIILGDQSEFIKLSISHALAQSVKLNVLEKSVSTLLNNTAPIQQELANTGSVSLSKKEISKQIGILFNERYSINLHSDILDTPEFFWRRPSYEPLYLMTAEFQDIQVRQNILTHRLNMIQELYNILSNELNNKHSSRLEITIVILIAIEVILALGHSNIVSKFLDLF